MSTFKTLTNFAVIISEEETECVDAVWFELIVGKRKSDEKTVIELRTWKRGVLEDVVTEFFDCRIRQNRLEKDFESLRESMAEAHYKSKLESWIEDIRHG